MSTPVALSLPLTEAAARHLRAGTAVRLSGTVFTARDSVHRRLAAGQAVPCDLREAVLYHCGPVVVRRPDGWTVTAAGPTTSAREEPYMAEILGRYRIRGIIGKGGMGPATLAACREVGCVYLHATGGAAQLLAACIRDVRAVYLLEELGAPEAIWELEVRDFPALVTMDAHGTNLHDQVTVASLSSLMQLLK